jgi:hypothetical protein
MLTVSHEQLIICLLSLFAELVSDSAIGPASDVHRS